MVDAYFLDSSALLKRYVPEVGTAWIQSITDAQNQNLLIVAHIAWVEISSAIARRQREGTSAVFKPIKFCQHSVPTGTRSISL
ncbi:type II toxin-antitoxin system VapC family toxin [Leptolyngbya sp. NK1-12]|uniref:type II toxin-antitoxin system VapC family toxin n=1 Tax=Leptolyngbya sp. NK1-12 TaxID=2547451 RepID=UPI00292CBC62|nr:type II toxin-antitoxin system VapC family toxin [Leptolyngbya sp. NK1-12]